MTPTYVVYYLMCVVQFVINHYGATLVLQSSDSKRLFGFVVFQITGIVNLLYNRVLMLPYTATGFLVYIGLHCLTAFVLTRLWYVVFGLITVLKHSNTGRSIVDWICLPAKFAIADSDSTYLVRWCDHTDALRLSIRETLFMLFVTSPLSVRDAIKTVLCANAVPIAVHIAAVRRPIRVRVPDIIILDDVRKGC